MKLPISLTTLTTLAVSAPRASLAQDAYLTLEAYGTSLQIADTELDYDQKQNHADGVAPTIGADHNSIHTQGNRWSAYALPSPLEIFEDSMLQFTFTLDQATAQGFNAICVDADREMTGTNGKCFVLDTSQGWIRSMANVAKLTPVGETTTHSIPVGYFMTGVVNYVAFIQDSDDSTDRSLGDMTFSNLSLVQEDPNKLEVEIDGVPEFLTNQQLSYKYKGGNQDTADWLMDISEDGAGVQLNGNIWKALPLNAPYNVTHSTVIEFDIVVEDPGDAHAICLDSNLDRADKENVCVSFFTPVDNFGFVLTTELVANEPKRLAIPFGQVMDLMDGDSQIANYLAFVQDNDAGDKRGARSTYSNIRIYEEDRMNIEIQVFGENVTVPNIQDHFTSSSSSSYVQDSKDHVMSVSNDGKRVTALGNSWKRFKLDTPFEVTPATILKFLFEVPSEAEIHTICLLQGINAQDGRNDCFSTAGRDVSSSNSAAIRVNPLTPDGGSHEYDIHVGSYFSGPVTHLGFALDNDKSYSDTRTQGESTWSDIQIYNLPSLNIGLHDGTKTDRTQITSQLVIENKQISYESSSQDSTPIAEHLMIISEDGSSITARGNTWRAMPLPTPLTATELGDFIVSFDYVLQEGGDFHAVCFEDNLELGDYDDPKDNQYDPKRCLSTNIFETISNKVFFTGYEPHIGEPYRYVANLSKLFDRFYEWKYFVIVLDNDVGDKSGGEMTVSNVQITTSLTSCLKDVSFGFVLNECTVDNFLTEVAARMEAVNCPGQNDPLLELMAFFDATVETDVYEKIEHICETGYDSSRYDFTKAISSETQLAGEFIDGGTVLNYESDSEGSNLFKDGAGIDHLQQFASTHLFNWPEHHALEHCDIGAAMCCWVDSRGDAALVDNTDVCYVNMKASRLTAHVRDGYSIYGDGNEGAVNCHGFAWGTDNGSTHSAMKGNALYKVGFLENLYDGLKGNVEQVPGAPMCGCLDRMPVVTHADCTKATDDASVMNVAYDAALGTYSATYTLDSVEYSDCGNLNAYYKTLVGAESHYADYMDTRIVGNGGCPAAINGFLAGKGLVQA